MPSPFQPLADIVQQGTLVVLSADYIYAPHTAAPHQLRLKLARRGMRFLETVVGHQLADLLEDLTVRLGFDFMVAARLLQIASGSDLSHKKQARN